MVTLFTRCAARWLAITSFAKLHQFQGVAGVISMSWPDGNHQACPFGLCSPVPGISVKQSLQASPGSGAELEAEAARSDAEAEAEEAKT